VINKVILVGRLGKDPEVKDAGCTKFPVATDERYKDRNGEKVERTEWHNVVAWGKLGEVCGKYLTKGAKVYIEGKIHTNSWEDSVSGEKKYRTEIIASEMKMLDSRKDGAAKESDDDGVPF
jgi:single-strand DNA-binding protein